MSFLKLNVLNMKRHLLSFAIVLLLSCSVYAGNTPDVPHISVTGQSTIVAVPDRLRLSLNLIDTGKNVEEVSKNIGQRTSILLVNLKSLGIAKKDINSSHLNIVPHYNWQNREQVYVGTEVSRTIEVILRDLGKYDEFIRTLLQAKVGKINSTELESSKESELRKQALQAAIKDARKQAELLVSDIPENIGSVYSIVHQSSMPVSRFSSGRYRASMEKVSSFEPGVIQFSESVAVVYHLSQ